MNLWMIRSARPNRLGSMSRPYMEGDVSSKKTRSLGVGTARNSRSMALGKASPNAISARAATNRNPRNHSCTDHDILEMEWRLAMFPNRTRIRRRCHSPIPQNRITNGMASNNQRYSCLANSIKGLDRLEALADAGL